MNKKENKKRYDLEKRTYEFARNVREFVKKLPKTMTNLQDIKQLVDASGSTGANYTEANEALSKKNFIMRIKICRKEAKESTYWLNLVDVGSSISLSNERETLANESIELTNIFGAIYRKTV